jgi:cytochrome c oxidase assembly protein subunit 15
MALATALPIVVYLQILLGALMRHLGAGLAIPDFPRSMGRLVPPFATTAIAVNFAHRVGATVVAIVVTAVLVRIFRSGPGPLRRVALMLTAVVALQIYLGAKVVWDGAENAAVYHSLAGDAALHHAGITSFHVMTGALTLATSLVLALSARAMARPSESRAPGFVAREVTA